MAATVNIEVGHGATVAWSIVASKMRFKLADNDLIDIVTPLKVFTGTETVNGSPTTSSLSWWKTLRVNVAVAPDVELTNLRFFRSSAGITAINELYGFTTTYLEAVGNTEGDNISGKNSLIAVIAMATTPVSISNGTGPKVGTGTFGDMTVIQWQVTNVAALGDSSIVTYTFRYDEV